VSAIPSDLDDRIAKGVRPLLAIFDSIDRHLTRIEWMTDEVLWQFDRRGTAPVSPIGSER
jgi:hypothetical protein